ncbi:hypothetical protein LEP3755_14420 [Leptolyngbya sp. NIES-3755]|nr:hypothetical protein LEP3755_14420 [Leptolyngbya sp. NIES-3755]
MVSEQQLLEKWRNLPTSQQEQVIEFLELLESQKTENSHAVPTIEIWSPYEGTEAAQVLLKLLENDPGEELA